jgi:Isochorismatase family
MVLDAVDIGYRVIVVRDAICSSSDEGHEMLMRMYHTRYTEQIETADAEPFLLAGIAAIQIRRLHSRQKWMSGPSSP